MEHNLFRKPFFNIYFRRRIVVWMQKKFVDTSDFRTSSTVCRQGVDCHLQCTGGRRRNTVYQRKQKDVHFIER